MNQFKRSRLTRTSDDQITRRTIVLGAFTLLLLVFILVFGLPFLIRFAVFLGDSRNKSDKVVETVLPPLAPRIFVPFEATNSAKVAILGVAEPGVGVELTKDSLVVGTTEASSTGEFGFGGIELDKGVNQFTALAVGKSNNKSDISKVLSIVYDDAAPVFSLSNPSADNVTVDSADFDISGMSEEKGVSVLVNGRVAMVANDGSFKLRLQLSQGKNEVEIIVRDVAGNETRKKVTITYDI